MTTPLPALEDHPHARAVLGPALPPGRASHAYLFAGPPGTGKRTVARAFAAALLADGAAEPGTVAERVSRGVHPDLAWITPSGAAEMLVGDVEQAVVAAAGRTPFESRRRVFVLEGADTMNDQAANRLLKTLEEPPEFAHLILLADRPEDVLPTIASRCQRVRFDPLPDARVAARLVAAGVPQERAEAAARLAQGSAERARLLASEPGAQLRAAAERLARSALAGDLATRPWRELLELARAAGERARSELSARLEAEHEVLGERERRRAVREAAEAVGRAERRARIATLDEGLRLSALWLRDVACVVLGLPELAHARDRSSALAEDAAGRSQAALARGVELVEDTRRRLAVNVGEELALEALCYRLEDALSPA